MPLTAEITATLLSGLAWALGGGLELEAGSVVAEGAGFVEYEEAQVSLMGAGGWRLAANRVRVVRGPAGATTWLAAGGGVRVVDEAGRDSRYLTGDYAWLDVESGQVVVVGETTSLMQGGWRLRARALELVAGATEVGIRGLRSGGVEREDGGEDHVGSGEEFER